MIDSILYAWSELKAQLEDQEQHRLNAIDKSLLIQLLNFMEPFHDSTLDFQYKNKPTLHSVFLWRESLVSHLDHCEKEHLAIKEMKSIGRAYLEEKWVLSPIHKLAAFLHPQVKCKRFNATEKSQVFSMINSEFERQETLNKTAEYGENSKSKSEVRPVDTQSAAGSDRMEEPPRKKKRSIIYSLIDKDDVSHDEIHRYLEKDVFVKEDEELDLCKWWKQHQKRFPQLHKIFIKYMCVPASVGTSETKFSLGAYLMNEKRVRLAPKKVDDILFLKSFFDERTC